MTSGATQALQSTAPAAPESEPAPSCPAHRQPVRYIDLHRSPDRHDYFAHATRGIAFDAALGRWIIDDPELITKVLTDPGFSTSDYAGVCRHMAQAGQPVANLAFAYENIPLCHDGDTHRHLRRTMSGHLATKRKSLADTLPLIVHRHFEPFTRSGEIEIMAEVLVPLVDDIMSYIVDAKFDAPGLLDAISSAFDRLMGPRKLMRIDEQIASIRDMIRRIHGSEDVETEGRFLALLMLGRDPLLATLGESLRDLFAHHHGQRLSAMTFPATPSETGVPFIERQANTDCQIAGETIRKGDRLRVLLQAYAYSDSERGRLKIFGTGAHACLGRPLALDIWREVVACLSKLDGAVAFRGSAPRKTDYVFTCPASLSIEILP